MEETRILLKLSGEALAGDKKTGFDEATVLGVASQVKEALAAGKQIAIVIGGGNFWRGRTSEHMDRVKADQIGILATVMNCVYVAEMFRTTGISTMVMTPFECGNITKLFRKDDAVAALEQGTVVFFAGGTGHPYFSTDMATVLMAIEIEAEVILAGKAIDGVYDSDPKTNPNAKKYDVMEMQDIVDQKLGVIDLTAAVLAAENHMPMKLFGLNGENSIVNAMTGTFTGTWIRA
jgi:uridylate kinase